MRLPIERFLEIRSASSGVYSYDDSALYFLSTMTGMPQVWRQTKDVPWPQQITFFRDRVMGVAASPTKPQVCVIADQGGTERAQLFLMDLDGLEQRNITNDEAHIYHFGGFSADGQWLAYSSNRRDGKHFDIYVYHIEKNEHRLVYKSDDTNHAVGFHPSEHKLVFMRQYSNMNSDLFLLHLDSGEAELLTAHEGEVVFGAPRFSADGNTLYLVTDKDSEFERVAALCLKTKNLSFVTPDEWDCEALSISKDRHRLAFARNEDGTSKLYVMSLEGQARHDFVEVANVPNGVIASCSWSKTDERIILTISSPVHATELWEAKLSTQSVKRVTYASNSAVPHAVYVEPELVHYPSFDGLSIPAYYYRPTGTDGPYPVIVYVHGGPESQSRNAFNQIVQYFVNQGYAVFVPNVRGSSGYGKTYVHLDDVRKRMDSVADLAQAVDFLVDRCHAKRDAIAVMGGSYGGFMVLAALTHYPELWSAGIDIVGIANLRTFIENTSPYRRHLRECEYGTIEDDGDFFDEISPIHHVDKITAPLMVIHGANDPRVPVGEAEQVVKALERRNHPVTYLCFEDEGHGVVKLPNRIKAYGEIAHFLKRHMPV